MVSSSVASDMNSSVSSVGVNESLLAEMNSDISIDFRKRKNKKWSFYDRYEYNIFNQVQMERGKSVRETQAQALREVIA